MNQEDRKQEKLNEETIYQETINEETINEETINQEVTNQGASNQKVIMEEDKKHDIINLTKDGNKEVSPDDRNVKERLYDKIPISLKALDIVIGVLIALLVIILLYFILRRFS